MKLTTVNLFTVKKVNIAIPKSDFCILTFNSLVHTLRWLYSKEKQSKRGEPLIDKDISFFEGTQIGNESSTLDEVLYTKQPLTVKEIFEALCEPLDGHIFLTMGQALECFNTFFTNELFSQKKDSLLVFFQLKESKQVFSLYGRRDESNRFNLHKLFVDNNFTLPIGTGVITQTESQKNE